MPKQTKKLAVKPRVKPLSEDDERARYKQFTAEILGLVQQLQEGRAADTGKVQTARVELTCLQRQTLLSHLGLKKPLRDRLNVPGEEITAFDFTLLEMMELVFPLAPMVKSSRGEQAKELTGIMHSLVDAMERLLGKETSPCKPKKKSRSSKMRK